MRKILLLISLAFLLCACSSTKASSVKPYLPMPPDSLTTEEAPSQSWQEISESTVDAQELDKIGVKLLSVKVEESVIKKEYRTEYEKTLLRLNEQALAEKEAYASLKGRKRPSEAELSELYEAIDRRVREDRKRLQERWQSAEVWQDINITTVFSNSDTTEHAVSYVFLVKKGTDSYSVYESEVIKIRAGEKSYLKNSKVEMYSDYLPLHSVRFKIVY